MAIERISITDRDQWLNLRKPDVTASVAGALLGVHDYVTPFALWALKSGAVAEDPEESGPMKRGRLLEPVAVQLLAEQQPTWKLERGTVYLRDPDARLGATPDLFVNDPERGLGIVQIKSVEASVFRRKWLDPETKALAPPLGVAVQGIVEAYLAEAKWAAVAALVVGFGIDLHVVEAPIHAGVIDTLKAKIVDFWRMVDMKEAPPADYGRDGEILAKLYAETNGEILDLSSDNRIVAMCEEDEELAEQAKKIAEARAAIKNEFIAKLGHAEGATCQGWSISAKTTKRKGYEVAPTSYRQIRKKRLTAKENAA